MILWIMSSIILISTPIIQTPFYGTENELITTCLSINIGFYIYRTVAECILRPPTGQLGVIIIHHMVALLTYFAMVINAENLMLGLVGTFMDASCISSDLMHILKSSKKDVSLKITRTLKVIECVLCILFRCILPLVFLILAILHQNPLKLSTFPLAIFFLSTIFFSLFSISLTKLSISSLCKRLVEEPGGEKNNDQISNEPSVRIGNQFDYLPPLSNTNVFYNNLEICEKVGTKLDFNTIINKQYCMKGSGNVASDISSVNHELDNV